MAENKVKFGISKAHYAPITGYSTETGLPTYGTVKPLPGAVSFSAEPQGDVSPFYADNIVFYQGAANNGYSGDFVIANTPEEFYTDVYKQTKDSKGVTAEYSNVEQASFALFLQFEGDVKATRHVFYNCTAKRPSSEASTIEANKTPQTDKITVSAVALENGLVKAKTTATTDADVYSNWFTTPYMPTASGTGE